MEYRSACRIVPLLFAAGRLLDPVDRPDAPRPQAPNAPPTGDLVYDRFGPTRRFPVLPGRADDTSGALLPSRRLPACATAPAAPAEWGGRRFVDTTATFVGEIS